MAVMLHLFRRSGVSSLRYHQHSWLVKDSTLSQRLQSPQLRPLHQTPSHKCNSVPPKLKLELSVAEQKDQLLYVVQKTRYFKLMNLFALSQFVFWSALGYSMLEMKDVEVPQKIKQDESLPWWRKYDVSYYKRPMGLTAFFIGWGVLTGCWLHTLRAVQHIVLRKGGRTVTIATHTPFGSNRKHTVPLDHVSAVSGRMGAPSSYMTLKVKRHMLHFLVDAEGNFVKPALYEKTMGVRRNFAATKRKT